MLGEKINNSLSYVSIKFEARACSLLFKDCKQGKQLVWLCSNLKKKIHLPARADVFSKELQLLRFWLHLAILQQQYYFDYLLNCLHLDSALLVKPTAQS